MASQTQSTRITDLPPELIGRIADFTYPPCLVGFASTCRFIFECCKDVLKRHRAAHAEYHTVNDRLPTTIPALLRKVMHDPIAAWHVRTLEIFGTRTKFNHWKEYQFEEEESSNRRGAAPPPDYALSQDERIQCLDILRESFHFPEEDIEKVREDLEKGNDAPIKLVLFGLCPELESLRYARRFEIESREDQWDPSTRFPMRADLNYLRRAIQIQTQGGHDTWPVGLDSLREVAVGVEAGIPFDTTNSQPPAHVLADVMKLPNVESVYCHGITQEIEDVIADDHENDPSYGTIPDYNLSAGSSSVKHIFLDEAHGLSWKFREAMISACKTLKSLTIRNSDMDDIDALIQKCSKHHKDNLETLFFYETGSLHGYRCSVYRPEELQSFTNLRTVWITASDVMLDAMYNYDGEVARDTGHQWIDNQDFFTEFFVETAFPRSLEVLVFGRQRTEPLSEPDANLLDHAVATMIESEEFSNLKAVYLDGLDVHRLYNEPPKVRTKRWFPKAIAAGLEAGIDIHTRTTRANPMHKIEFPKPVRAAGLESASEAQGKAFHLYSGTWRPRDCGNCGNCSVCFQRYSPEVWKEINALDPALES